MLAIFAVFGLLTAGYLVRGAIGDTEVATTASSSGGTPVSLPTGQTPSVDNSGDEPAAKVAAAVAPAVVQIQVQTRTEQGLGSGVIYDSSGLILTNNHVVADATAVQVVLADGTAYDGEVLGTDPNTDVAVVKIDTGTDLPVARLATTDPEVGQLAIAIGSPFGLEGTVTAGIVSAVDRPVANDQQIAVNMIQTDAPINPGNSGGALANRNGEIIGINTAIFSEKGENNGIGFAIPIDTARRVAEKIVNGQSLAKASLGIKGDPTETSTEPGAIVAAVTSGGPADLAGIQAEDRIVAVDGKAIRDFESLQGEIGTFSPGDSVQVQIVRGTQIKTVEVTLGASR